MEPTTTDPAAWLGIGKFLAEQFGPGGFVLFLVAAAEAYALYKALHYFGGRDDQKRGDVLKIVETTAAALKDLQGAVHKLQVVIAAKTGNSDV